MLSRGLVALTGMPGARKSDAAAIGVQELGILVFNMSTLIREEILGRGMIPTPEVYHEVALDLRAQFGPEVLAARSLQRLVDVSPFCVVDGVRTPAEIDYFRSHTAFFRVICIHASREERFARMKARSGPELQTRDDLLRQDRENLQLGLGEVMALADYVVINGDYAPQPFELAARVTWRRVSDECRSKLSD